MRARDAVRIWRCGTSAVVGGGPPYACCATTARSVAGFTIRASQPCGARHGRRRAKARPTRSTSAPRNVGWAQAHHRAGDSCSELPARDAFASSRCETSATVGQGPPYGCDARLRAAGNSGMATSPPADSRDSRRAGLGPPWTCVATRVAAIPGCVAPLQASADPRCRSGSTVMAISAPAPAAPSPWPWLRRSAAGFRVRPSR